MSKRYSEAFKIAAVGQVVANGERVAEAAERLGVSAHSLYDWLKHYRDNAESTVETLPTEQPPQHELSHADNQRSPAQRATRWTNPTNLHLAPRPKKSPKQSRSKHLVSAIRVACLQIIENEGAVALNTNRIAEVAGVGIASVYQYFPNKDAILAAIYDQLLDRELEATEQSDLILSQLDSRQILENAIDRGIALRLRLLDVVPEFYQKYHREFGLYAKYFNPGESGGDAIEASLAAVGDLFTRFGDDMRVPNTVVTRFLFSRGIGAIVDKAAEDSPELLEDPEFRSFLKVMAIGFLLKPKRTMP
jgi:AcrR family transcriptional regulator